MGRGSRNVEAGMFVVAVEALAGTRFSGRGPVADVANALSGRVAVLATVGGAGNTADGVIVVGLLAHAGGWESE